MIEPTPWLQQTKNKDTTMLEANQYPLPSVSFPSDPSPRPTFQNTIPPPIIVPSQTSSQPNSSHNPPPANWAKNLKKSTDKSLKKVANPSFSPEGIPRIKVPDSVFKKGADLHQDFVLGIFLGKTPSFSQIQSVLTHIWGRGMKLEIHLRPESRSMLVRIPNSTIRSKIVEQEFWHVGNVLFYVAQWSDSVAQQPPTFTTMPLWAHFRGIPFDLYTQAGLGRVGDLLGHPIEVDEFTRKMTNINVAHIKCRIDCTKPLPKFGELERENGEVVTVSIDYPWVPPICPCCGELGHLQTHCPSGVWKTKTNPTPVGPNKQGTTDKTQETPSHETADKTQETPSHEAVDPPHLPTAQDASAPILVSQDTPQTQQSASATDLQRSPTTEENILAGTIPTTDAASVAPCPDKELVLDSDGSIISPPSSPPHPSSPPSSPDPFIIPFHQLPHDNLLPHPSKISHLLALPAIHHPRPVKINSSRKPPPTQSSESKFPLSVNPFACLAPDPPPSSFLSDLLPSTVPAEGSLLPEGEKPNQ